MGNASYDGSEVMAEKVVHISEEVHEAAKAFCKKNKRYMKQWVSGLILDAIEREKREANIYPSPR